MFSQNIKNKISVAILGVSIVATMGLTGCTLSLGGDDNQNEVTDNRDNGTNQVSSNQENNNPNDSNNQNLSNTQDDPSGTNIPFKAVTKRAGTETPLQKDANGSYKDGIFYFTPNNPDNLNIDPGYNAWLIQLPTLGKQVNVEKIKKVGPNKYEIYVHRRLDLDAHESLKPSYGFIQVLDSQMPTYSKFKIYDIDQPGKQIWP